MAGASLYPGFISMKHLGVLLLPPPPLDGMLLHPPPFKPRAYYKQQFTVCKFQGTKLTIFLIHEKRVQSPQDFFGTPGLSLRGRSQGFPLGLLRKWPPATFIGK